MHVPGEGRQRVVADLADPVAAHQDLHEAAHIAPARHGLLLDAGDRRVLEVVRGGPGPVPHAGQQDRRLEHGDGVGGGGEIAVAAGGAHDLHRPAEEFGLVQPVEGRRALQEAGELVGGCFRCHGDGRRCGPPRFRRLLRARLTREPEGLHPGAPEVLRPLGGGDGDGPGGEAELCLDRRVAGRDQAVLPGALARRSDLEGVAAVDTELLDAAGRVEGTADVEAVPGIGAGRGEVLAHPRPHVALAVLVHPDPAGVPGGQTAEEAADQEHDLAVGVVVAVAERQLDVLVPPLRPVPHATVVQEVLLEFGEAGPQVTDLHPDGVAVQRRLLLRGPVVRTGGLLVARLPLEHVVRGTVDEDQLDTRGVQCVGDGLVFGRRLGDRGDDRQGCPFRGEALDVARERLDGHRQTAVAELGQEGRHVLAQLQVHHLRLLLAQPPCHGDR